MTRTQAIARLWRLILGRRPWRADFTGGPLDGATKELLDSASDEWLFIIDHASGPTELQPIITPDEFEELIYSGLLHVYRLRRRRFQRIASKRYTYAGRVRPLAPGIAGIYGP